jgi:glycerate dehydrogenase
MRIVILDGYTTNPGDLSWSELEALGEVKLYNWTDHKEIADRLSGTQAAITNKVKLDAETLSKLPELEYIGIMATGTDNVDLEAAKKYGIVVTNVPVYADYSVAQLTFALILELCYGTYSHSKSIIEDKIWSKQQFNSYWLKPLDGLEGKTIGIIGMGRIGERVAGIATAFGMKVLAYDVYKRELVNVIWATLDELLHESDIVSTHCPLLESTKGMMNKKALSKMKKTAYYINTSRGSLVVEKDLADALNDGVIAGAGLDVLAKEPPGLDNPLLSAKNIVITPHIGWATVDARKRLISEVALNLKAYMNNEKRNTVV